MYYVYYAKCTLCTVLSLIVSPIVGSVGQECGHVEHDLIALELAVHAVKTRTVVCKENNIHQTALILVTWCQKRY